MNSAPIDLVKLAEQTLEDLIEFSGEDLHREILVMALYAAYQAGYEHGDAHGWHEDEEFQQYVNNTNLFDEEC